MSDKMDESDDMPPLMDDVSAVSTSLQSSNSAISNVLTNGKDNVVPVTVIEDEVDENDDDDETQWKEIDEEVPDMKCYCFFCDEFQQSPCTLFSHMEVKHQFSMKSMACHWSFDQVTYIKYVNYIRKEKPKPPFALSVKPVIFQNQDFMKPIIPNDPLLMFDVEEFYEYSDESDEEVATLREKCDELEDIVQKQREALSRLLEEVHGGRELKAVKTVSDIVAEEDEGYFNSYAYFDIHHEMLSDKIRTEAYRDAILKNKCIFNNKNILDLGCGTGILSMFAAKAGAKVLAVDMSEVIYHAIDIVKENKLDDSITLRKGRLEDLNFQTKFDVIVSEWMGYFLLFEGMLDSVIYARNHYLAPGGYLLPNRCTLHLAGAEDLESYDKFIDFWHDVYGFKMSCMVKDVIKEATTAIVKEELICTSSDQIGDFNLMTVTPQELEFQTNFTLTAARDAKLTCFIGYFDTYFDLPTQVYFSTGPHAPPTHWKQTIFFLPKARPVKKGEVLKGSIAVRRKKKEIRSLDVLIYFEEKRYHYFVE